MKERASRIRGRAGWRCAGFLFIALWAAAPWVSAQEPIEELLEDPLDPTIHGPVYTVSQFDITFGDGFIAKPATHHLLALPIHLGRLDSGYTSPGVEGENLRVKLADVPALPAPRFHASALEAVIVQLTQHFADGGYTGVVVRPHPEDIADDGKDLRPVDRTALRLVVAKEGEPWEVSRVATLQTRATPRRPGKPGQPLAESTDPRPPSIGVVRGSARMIVKAGTQDGSRYPVERVSLEYAQPHPHHPSLDGVLHNNGVYLLPTGNGYIGAGPERANRALFVRLDELRYLDKPFLHASAIQQVSAAVVQHFTGMGFIGVTVVPHAEDIGPQAEDLRPEGQTNLRLVVRIGRVSEIRTLASGERINSGETLNHPLHARLRENMPVRDGDLLRKDRLDDYISWLNRHPGRRVDVALSAARQPGGSVVDLLVAENKPWTVYAQASNTGTSQTDEWRERFGFTHNQLTNNDDILSLDYVTAGFESAHAFIGSYEAPVFEAERLRWRATGFWSQFTASDVGFAGEQFSGEEWFAGGDLIFNVYQHKELFVDLLAGARYQRDHVQNETVAEEGDADFLLPSVGVQLERFTDVAATSVLVQYEINVLDVDEAELAGSFGRLLTDGDGDFTGNKNFSRVNFDASQSLYLEPVLWRDEWLAGTDPDLTTLAHELFVGVKGQYSPDRNIPQFERTAGGLYSVRGYDESVVAGDTVVILNAEYRFHVPRIFAVEPTPRRLMGKTFRYAPQQPYGRTDWDLILRGFFDYAQTYNNSAAETFEADTDLASVGVGTELVYKRHMNIRMDWGFVLRGVDGVAEEGDDRLHIVATFLY